MLREKPSITPMAYYTPRKGTADLFLHITSNYKFTGFIRPQAYCVN
jgi:hypothetical protein